LINFRYIYQYNLVIISSVEQHTFVTVKMDIYTKFGQYLSGNIAESYIYVWWQSPNEQLPIFSCYYYQKILQRIPLGYHFHMKYLQSEKRSTTIEGNISSSYYWKVEKKWWKDICRKQIFKNEFLFFVLKIKIIFFLNRNKFEKYRIMSPMEFLKFK